MKNYDYVAELKLKHHELPAKVDASTGELISVGNNRRPNNIPEGKEHHLPKEKFFKPYPKTWSFLYTVLTDLEFKIVFKLCSMAKMNTNSLEPLNDEIAMAEIARIFEINKNTVGPMFKKFYNLGIYANFDVKKVDVPYTKYWILNPYLAFNGKLITSDIAKLFVGTMIEKQYRA